MTEQRPQDTVRKVYFTEDMPFTTYDYVQATAVEFVANSCVRFVIRSSGQMNNERVTVPLDKVACIK